MVSLANLIRCLGLYLIIHALATILPIVFYTGEYVSEVGSPASIYVIPTILYFAGGLLMTFKGGSIAEYLARAESVPNPIPGLEAGIYLIGIWWFFQGISDLTYQIFAIQQEQSVGTMTFTDSREFPYFVATLFELGAAGFLLIKGHQISRYLISRQTEKP